MFKNPPAGDLSGQLPRAWHSCWACGSTSDLFGPDSLAPAKALLCFLKGPHRRVKRPHISANFGLTFPFSPGQSRVFAQGPEEWDHTRCPGARLRARPARPGTCSLTRKWSSQEGPCPSPHSAPLLSEASSRSLPATTLREERSLETVRKPC